MTFRENKILRINLKVFFNITSNLIGGHLLNANNPARSLCLVLRADKESFEKVVQVHKCL